MAPLARLMWAAGACPPTVRPAPADIIIRWQRRNITPQYDVQVIPGENDELVAFVQVGIFKEGTARLNFEIAVHPDYRRQGIGTALYELVMQRAERSPIAQITTPVYTLPGKSAGGVGAWLMERGFNPGHSFWQMRIDDISEFRGPHLPDGIGVRTFSDMEYDPGKWANLIMNSFGEAASAAGVIAQLSEPGVSRDGYFFAVTVRGARSAPAGRASTWWVGRPWVISVPWVFYRRTEAVRSPGPCLGKRFGTSQRKACPAQLSSVENSNTAARTLYEKLGWRYVYLTNHYVKAVKREK